MKTKYLFIKCDDMLSSKTPLYIIMAGVTKQAQRDISFLQGLDKKRFFFAKWTQDVDAYFWNLRKAYKIREEQVLRMDIRALVRHLKEQLPLPQSRFLTPSEISVRLNIDTSFCLTYNRK